MALNRGEWSELYAIIYLLLHNDLNIENEFLEPIANGVFLVKGISVEETEGEIKFNIIKNGDVQVVSCDEVRNIIEKVELDSMVENLLNAIITVQPGNGAFTIPEINSTLSKLTRNNKIKAKSTLKEDATLFVFDNIMKSIQPLKYSIKSMLGSPATLLNASGNTNFIYEIIGLTREQILEINNINTRTKLYDRCQKIIEYNAEVNFIGMESSNFEYNLKLIDSNMPKYLANVLFQSYVTGNKKLKGLFLENTMFCDEEYALHKLGQFLEGISFDFFPNKKWNRKRLVNGGLIIVSHDGKVGILDLIYHHDIVYNYLIDNTKLESSSSTRYNMFEIYEQNDKFYFTLNLQVRYER